MARTVASAQPATWSAVARMFGCPSSRGVGQPFDPLPGMTPLGVRGDHDVEVRRAVFDHRLEQRAAGRCQAGVGVADEADPLLGAEVDRHRNEVERAGIADQRLGRRERRPLAFVRRNVGNVGDADRHVERVDVAGPHAPQQRRARHGQFDRRCHVVPQATQPRAFLLTALVDTIGEVAQDARETTGHRLGRWQHERGRWRLRKPSRRTVEDDLPRRRRRLGQLDASAVRHCGDGR